MTRLSKRGFMEGRPKKFDDPKVMQEQIEAYFRSCDEQTKMIINDKGQTKMIYKPYTITGLCLALNIESTNTLMDYENDPMFSRTVKMAKKIVENWVEEKSLTGDINATTAIFNLKNNFGWKDKTEVETNDVSKEKYEGWLKENERLLNPVKTIDNDEAQQVE
jgi:hypothetical protein